ncbi:MAG TPA: hypothetical protein VH500_13750 [Nitrososphaeraceae archaeon]|jgi:hypothetical protein
MPIKIDSWKIPSLVIVLVLSTSLVCSQMQVGLGWAISDIHQMKLNLVRAVKYKINSTAVNSNNPENCSFYRR